MNWKGGKNNMSKSINELLERLDKATKNIEDALGTIDGEEAETEAQQIVKNNFSGIDSKFIEEIRTDRKVEEVIEENGSVGRDLFKRFDENIGEIFKKAEKRTNDRSVIKLVGAVGLSLDKVINDAIKAGEDVLEAIKSGSSGGKPGGVLSNGNRDAGATKAAGNQSAVSAVAANPVAPAPPPGPARAQQTAPPPPQRRTVSPPPPGGEPAPAAQPVHQQQVPKGTPRPRPAAPQPGNQQVLKGHQRKQQQVPKVEQTTQQRITMQPATREKPHPPLPRSEKPAEPRTNRNGSATRTPVAQPGHQQGPKGKPAPRGTQQAQQTVTKQSKREQPPPPTEIEEAIDSADELLKYIKDKGGYNCEEIDRTIRDGNKILEKLFDKIEDAFRGDIRKREDGGICIANNLYEESVINLGATEIDEVKEKVEKFKVDIEELLKTEEGNESFEKYLEFTKKILEDINTALESGGGTGHKGNRANTPTAKTPTSRTLGSTQGRKTAQTNNAKPQAQRAVTSGPKPQGKVASSAPQGRLNGKPKPPTPPPRSNRRKVPLSIEKENAIKDVVDKANELLKYIEGKGYQCELDEKYRSGNDDETLRGIFNEIMLNAFYLIEVEKGVVYCYNKTVEVVHFELKDWSNKIIDELIESAQKLLDLDANNELYKYCLESARDFIKKRINPEGGSNEQQGYVEKVKHIEKQVNELSGHVTELGKVLGAVGKEQEEEK